MMDLAHLENQNVQGSIPQLAEVGESRQHHVRRGRSRSGYGKYVISEGHSYAQGIDAPAPSNEPPYTETSPSAAGLA